jgi:hypothetical protein
MLVTKPTSEDDLTITINDAESITLTLDDCLSGTNLDFTLSDGMYSTAIDTITVPTGDYTTAYSYTTDASTFTLDSMGFDIKPEITLGKTKLSEEQLKKVLTILDMFEEDPDLLEQLKYQSAIKKLKD